MVIIRIGIALIIILASSLAAYAQDQRTRDLERKLQERDKIILELLNRVEALEKRIGIAPYKKLSEQSEKAASPAPKAENDNNADMDNPEPGVVQTDEVTAERALERSLTRSGVLLLPRGILEIEPGISYARSESSTPQLFVSNGQLVAGGLERNTDAFTLDMALRLGLPWDAQLEFGLPYRAVSTDRVQYSGFTQFDSTNQTAYGLGDLRIGLAKTLLRKGVWLPDLVGRLTWDTNTGEIMEDGVALGGGYNELRASLTAIKRQDPLVFVGGLSYEYSFEENEFQPGSLIAASFGSFIALSPETSMRFLISAAYQEESSLSGSKVPGSDRTPVSFTIGATSLIAPGVLVNFSLGIGLTEDADDFSLSVSVPFRLKSPLF